VIFAYLRLRPKIRAVEKIKVTSTNRVRAATQALATSFSVPSDIWLNMYHGSVAMVPENGFKFTVLPPNAVNSNGAVSPATRAIPKITAVIKPVLADGKTT
jgi:hypothetical protein